MLINFIHNERETGMAWSRDFNNVNRILCVFRQLSILLSCMVVGSSQKMAKVAPQQLQTYIPPTRQFQQRRWSFPGMVIWLGVRGTAITMTRGMESSAWWGLDHRLAPGAAGWGQSQTFHMAGEILKGQSRWIGKINMCLLWKGCRKERRGMDYQKRSMENVIK